MLLLLPYLWPGNSSHKDTVSLPTIQNTFIYLLKAQLNSYLLPEEFLLYMTSPDFFAFKPLQGLKIQISTQNNILLSFLSFIVL